VEVNIDKGALALWNKGRAVILAHKNLLHKHDSSDPSQFTIPRGKLKDHYV